MKTYNFRQFILTVEPLKSPSFTALNVSNAKQYYACKKTLKEMTLLCRKVYSKGNTFRDGIESNIKNAVYWGKSQVASANPVKQTYRGTLKFTFEGNKKSVTFDSNKGLRDLYNKSREYIQTYIQGQRAARRQMYVETRTISGRRNRSWSIQSIGNCFTEPGGILKLQEQRSVLSVLDEKTPRTDDKYVGIEIEFISRSGQSELAKKMDKEGLGKWVNLKGDGSVEPDEDDGEWCGHEATVLAKENEFEEVIKKLIAVIQSDEGYVNKTCGMHVHLDMRSRNRDLAFSNLVSAQTILYAMNPKSRRTSTYCQRTDTKVFRDAERRGDRYQGVNACSFSRHKTLEVRIHSGTIDVSKICNWVKILIHVADHGEEVAASPRKVETFAEKFKITDANLVNYMNERIAKFRTGSIELDEVA